MAKKDYTNWDRKELIKEIDQLRKRKKYGLVWEDKPEDVVEQCKTELPVLEEVKGKEIITDPDKPINLLIEGDNYHALSVLNYTHKGKIDVIYIDPPYNTGGAKEWKFNDQWIDKNDTYKHSKWLSFISKRLDLAKKLLKEDGVILISIDDNEYAQLKLFCDSLFGEKQYVGSLVWEKKKKGSHLDGAITNVKEYILVYCKNSVLYKGLIGEIKEEIETYPCLNPGNGFSKRIIPAGITSNYKENNHELAIGTEISAGNMKLKLLSHLIIKDRILKNDVAIEAEWRYSQASLDEFATNGELYLTRDLYLRRIVKDPREKKLKDLLLRTSSSGTTELYEDLINAIHDERPKDEADQIISKIRNAEKSDYSSAIDPNNLYKDGWGSNEDGDDEQREFFGEKIFDYPKPSRLMEKLIAATQIKKGIVLDFFAGTGTTGEAVLKLENKNRAIQFILCANNEDFNGNGKKIAEDVCYPRISKVINGYNNRAGEKIEALKGNLKYFKTAFVPADPTDKNKTALTKKATEMLCVKEDTFEKIKSNEQYVIFGNKKRYTGIIYDHQAIDVFKKEISKIDGKFSVYVFSLGDDTFDEEFEDMKSKVKVSPIPEAILRVYRRIFK